MPEALSFTPFDQMLTEFIPILLSCCQLIEDRFPTSGHSQLQLVNCRQIPYLRTQLAVVSLVQIDSIPQDIPSRSQLRMIDSLLQDILSCSQFSKDRFPTSGHSQLQLVNCRQIPYLRTQLAVVSLVQIDSLPQDIPSRSQLEMIDSLLQDIPR